MTVKDRTTGAVAFFGFTTDQFDQTITVRDGTSGLLFNRTFRPGLMAVGSIGLVADLSIRQVDVELNGLDPRVENAVRGFSPRQGPIQIYSGVLDPATRVLVGPAEPIFVGFIDQTPIATPEQQVMGSTVVLRCNSYGFELTRNNPDTRSNASQKARHAGDKFFRHVQNVPDWKVRWGTKNGKPNHKRKGGKNDKGSGADD
jgi:hypothetical protein